MGKEGVSGDSIKTGTHCGCLPSWALYLSPLPAQSWLGMEHEDWKELYSLLLQLTFGQLFHAKDASLLPVCSWASGKCLEKNTLVCFGRVHWTLSNVKKCSRQPFSWKTQDTVFREYSGRQVHNENKTRGTLVDLEWINYNTVFINLQSSVVVRLALHLVFVVHGACTKS